MVVRAESPTLTGTAKATAAEEEAAAIMEKTRTETLWAELQKIQQTEIATLKRKREELEQEKASMNSLPPDASDVVTINVGGELILQAHRDTLCLAAPGSRFAALFSGRWEDHCVKDSRGRIFLDQDPELVRLIVNYMRIKRIEDPSDPLDPPEAPKEKRKEWLCLLKHYGLTPFFTKQRAVSSLLDITKITLIQPHGSRVSAHNVGQSLQLAYDYPSNGHYFVACSPCLAPGTLSSSSWKVTIKELPPWRLALLGFDWQRRRG
jgi:BTB/POZ domain